MLPCCLIFLVKFLVYRGCLHNVFPVGEALRDANLGVLSPQVHARRAIAVAWQEIKILLRSFLGPKENKHATLNNFCSRWVGSLPFYRNEYSYLLMPESIRGDVKPRASHRDPVVERVGRASRPSLLFHQIRAGRPCHSVCIAPKAFGARVPSTCLLR